MRKETRQRLKVQKQTLTHMSLGKVRGGEANTTVSWTGTAQQSQDPGCQVPSNG